MGKTSKKSEVNEWAAHKHSRFTNSADNVLLQWVEMDISKIPQFFLKSSLQYSNNAE